MTQRQSSRHVHLDYVILNAAGIHRILEVDPVLGIENNPQQIGIIGLEIVGGNSDHRLAVFDTQHR